MWAILFSLALAAAVCFGGAAVVLVYSKYLARLGGGARLRGALWGRQGRLRDRAPGWTASKGQQWR